MKVILRDNVLSEIVEDGVKEMLRGFNIPRRGRRNLWFNNLMDVLTRYKSSVKDKLIPTIVSDFSGSITIKMTGSKMQKEDVKKVKEFADRVLESNVKNYEEELLEEMKITLLNCGKEGLDIEELVRIAKNNHQWIIKRFNEYIREMMFQQLRTNIDEKCMLEPKIYNFTNKIIPEEVKRIFEKWSRICS